MCLTNVKYQWLMSGNMQQYVECYILLPARPFVLSNIMVHHFVLNLNLSLLLHHNYHNCYSMSNKNGSALLISQTVRTLPTKHHGIRPVHLPRHIHLSRHSSCHWMNGESPETSPDAGFYHQNIRSQRQDIRCWWCRNPKQPLDMRKTQNPVNSGSPFNWWSPDF